MQNWSKPKGFPGKVVEKTLGISQRGGVNLTKFAAFEGRDIKVTKNIGVLGFCGTLKNRPLSAKERQNWGERHCLVSWIGRKEKGA